MSALEDIVAALRGGLNPMDETASMPRENPIATGVAHKLHDLATLPKRAIENSANAVATGTYDPSVPMEAAMTMMTGGMPMAQKGAAGMFGGRLSPAADRKALQEAERMTAGGRHADDIWHDTGWAKFPTDNKWRFEIPDDKMRLKYMPMREGERATGSVEALVHHPDLYKAYPDARAVGADITKNNNVPSGSGLFMNSTERNWPTAYVVAPDQRIANSIMGHELQHFLQRKEQFSPGINPSYIAQRYEHAMRSNPERWGTYDFNTVQKHADDLYRRTAGEVEARNVQARQSMSANQRQRVPPWATQDVPFADQVTFDPVTEIIRELRRR